MAFEDWMRSITREVLSDEVGKIKSEFQKFKGELKDVKRIVEQAGEQASAAMNAVRAVKASNK